MSGSGGPRERGGARNGGGTRLVWLLAAMLAATAAGARTDVDGPWRPLWTYDGGAIDITRSLPEGVPFGLSSRLQGGMRVRDWKAELLLSELETVGGR